MCRKVILLIWLVLLLGPAAQTLGGNMASNPIPTNGATGVDPGVVLSWTPGDNATSHDVYFGTNYNDVNDATTASPHYQGNQDPNSYDPSGLLEFCTTYYWRIDQVNEATAQIWKGEVWSFTTAGCAVDVWVDDDFDGNTPGWGIDHFDSIQEGIDAVPSNGKVYIFGGSYSEDLLITTALTIQSGPNWLLNGNLTVEAGGSLTLDSATLKLNVTYDGQYHIEVKSGGGMYIQNRCVITDGDGDDDTLAPESPENHRFLFWVREGSTFEMRDSDLHETGHTWANPGLFVAADNAIVDRCMLSSNYCGAVLASSTHSSIANSTARSNNWAGIVLYSASKNNLLKNNNVVSNSDFGILLWDVEYNTVTDNIAQLNNWHGLWLYNSRNNILRGNHASNTGYAIGLMSSSNNNILENNIATSNEWNGISLYDSSNNTVSSNQIWGNDYGIRLYPTCVANVIQHNTITSNRIGVFLDSALNTEVSRNTISDNTGDGVWCTNTTATTANRNDIVDNGGYGLRNDEAHMPVDAKYNWWGDPSGPSGVGPGSGDEVSGYAYYAMWLTHPFRVAIPAVSGWSLILMALSLAAAGTIVIWWRRKRRLA